jgi:hypothetical protein
MKGTDMKVQLKATALKIKNHVVRHRVSYVVGGIASAAIVLQQRNRKAFEGFLVEKGIDPMEFYFPESVQELAS